MQRFPPHLAWIPDPSLLSPQETSDLRSMFKDYAAALLKVQKKADIRSWMDGVGLAASFAGTWIPPLSLGSLLFGAGVFARNRLADRAWGRRLKDLKDISEWIQYLL